MSIATILPWGQLALGVFLIGNAFAKRRSGRWGSNDAVIVGAMSVAFAATHIPVAWVGYAAWTVVAVSGAWMMGLLFLERSRIVLYVTLPFVIMMLAISVTELLLDSLTALQITLFAGMALVFFALVITMIVRVIRPAVNPAVQR